jgi:hypothetical protein
VSISRPPILHALQHGFDFVVVGRAKRFVPMPMTGYVRRSQNGRMMTAWTCIIATLKAEAVAAAPAKSRLHDFTTR